jgi:hypothetical protein
LTDLLYACLVTGFNLVTLDSLTRDGTTVTGTLSTGHGFASGQTVRIAGANEPDYNGDFVVTVLSGTQFTYEITGTPTSPATGTITAKRAPLGWSRPYSGTNKAVFQASAGTQFYLRVDDNGPGSAGAKEALCRGYESMSDVDTGTGLFPTTVQLSSGVVWRKSNGADATARMWNLIGDDRFFYLSIESHQSIFGSRQLVYFGDITSFKAGDNFNCVICGKHAMNNTNTVNQRIYVAPVNSISDPQVFAARSYSQVGSSAPLQNAAIFYYGSSYYYMSGKDGFSGPNPADLGYHMSPVLLQEIQCLRGTLPGLWSLPFVRPFTHWAALDNVDNLSGRILRAVDCGEGTSEGTSAYGQFLIDVTGPWR